VLTKHATRIAGITWKNWCTNSSIGR